jgi:hypothetical protein
MSAPIVRILVLAACIGLITLDNISAQTPLTPGIHSVGDYPIRPVPFTSVRLTGGFWKTKQDTNREVTIPFAFKQCEQSGRLKNFDLAAEVMQRRASGDKHFQIKPPTQYPFDDTDVYKSIEAAAYMLSMGPDPDLERKADEWIKHVAAAQEPDGYLYTFRTMHPDSPGHPWVGKERWENDPKLSHELYDCGHLYQAGVAYYLATGNRALLDVCLKNAELLWRDFGDGKRRLAPGHQIVEMGLVQLYRVTGDQRWLKLAKIFLDNRGPGGSEYNQMHKLVVDQDTAVGHAVRANYMYSGMADVAALTGDQHYLAAINKIWENIVSKKLYITGGVGAHYDGEAFGADYELPPNGYNETCAAVAFMQFNHRMFLLTGDAKYMDVFERTAYNGFISGVSESGDRFFYPNPLCYDGKAKNNNGFAGRAPWFGCACCPPNLMRTLASLTGYFYATRGDSLYVNLYSQSEGVVQIAGTSLGLRQVTNYPWDGSVKLDVSPARPATFTLRLRIPGWAQGHPVPSDLYSYENPGEAKWGARVNGQPVAATLQDGYLSVNRVWRTGDSVELDFATPVQFVRGNDKISAIRGQVAFERGPIVFCAEAINQPLPTAPLAPPISTTGMSKPDVFHGAVTLQVKAANQPAFTAIPYYTWNNRGLAPMEVWFPTIAPTPGNTNAQAR